MQAEHFFMSNGFSVTLLHIKTFFRSFLFLTIFIETVKNKKHIKKLFFPKKHLILPIF